MMKTLTKRMSHGLLATVLVFSAPVWAGDVYLISNSTIKLTAADAKDVLLGEKQFADGKALHVVDNAAALADFTDKVLRMNPGQYKTYWAKKSFRDGVKMPSPKNGDADVLDFVKNTPGAVGYVSSQPSGVTVIQKY